jgi:hypothetical protein
MTAMDNMDYMSHKWIFRAHSTTERCLIQIREEPTAGIYLILSMMVKEKEINDNML